MACCYFSALVKQYNRINYGGRCITKMQKKQKIIMLIALILIQSLFFFNNIRDSKALQDDSNVQVTLHCKLLSSSAEISSELMTTGTYDFFDSPELDVIASIHDMTQINLENVQRLTINKTNTSSGNFSKVYGIYTFASTAELPEYTVSAPFDTRIDIVIDFSTNATRFSLAEEIDMSDINEHVLDLYYLNGYYYILDYRIPGGAIIRKYTYNWTFTGFNKSISGYPLRIAHYNGYWYLTHEYAKKICKYDSNWNYVSSYELDIYPKGIEYYNGYFYVTAGKNIIKYTTTFTKVKTYSYNNLDTEICDLVYDNISDCFWMTYGIYNETSKCLYINRLNANLSLSDNKYLLDVNSWGGLYINEGYFFATYPDSSNVCTKIYKYFGYMPFRSLSILNFTYGDKISGNKYYQNITAQFIPEESDLSTEELLFRFSSNIFGNFNHSYDLTIYRQNLTIKMDSWIKEQYLNFTIYAKYSQSNWAVPSEVDLSINGVSVDDETYNSGILSLSAYPNNLIISSSSENIYFKLNITSIFTFTFSLDIVSRTYLRKYFELLSNHDIVIERIDLPPELHIKKLYLNNIEYSNQSFLENNIFYITPAITMNPGNIFKLEIILADDIYIPLTYITNSVGHGTSQLFLTATANTLTYTNLNRFNSININIPDGFSVEHANLSLSNIKYKPYYVSNNSHNINKINAESQNYREPIITYKNSTENLDYYDILEQTKSPCNITIVNGTLIQNGTLNASDNNCFIINSEGTGHFPASYSFTNQSEGEAPIGFTRTSTGIYIKDSLNGHKKVILINGTGGRIEKRDTNYANGTEEFWFYVTNTSVTITVLEVARDTYPYRMMMLDIRDGHWYCASTNTEDDRPLTELPDPQPCTWHHVKIDWRRSDAPSWQGLNPGKWRVTVDGVQSDQLYWTKNYGAYTYSLDKFRHNGVAGENTSYDAIGYSWLSNYTLSENKIDIPQTINITATAYFNVSLANIKSLNITYSYKTSIPQIVNISIYNFEKDEFELIYSNISQSFTIFYYNKSERAQNYLNASNRAFIIRIIAINNTSNFTFYLDLLNITINYYNGATLKVAPSL
ncbi:MAG: hypothetical protein ACP6IY_19295, partial [Promethearchaeia archaeon]